MVLHAARQPAAGDGIEMPDQVLHVPFKDAAAPGMTDRRQPYAARAALLSLVIAFSASIFGILFFAFQSDNRLSLIEVFLISMMTLLAGWEAISTGTAILGFINQRSTSPEKSCQPLTIAILVTMRDENAQQVLPRKIALLRSLQSSATHRFSLHVLSDSRLRAHIEDERRLVRLAQPLPVFIRHRDVNRDFKSGNIRDWIESNGAPYDAVMTLDADSEVDLTTALMLADALGRDPACGLVQTLPLVLRGQTHWQNMQSIASHLCGGLQGRGLSAWMGDEANYFGHNAIIRTKAFAASAGLPHIKGRGLWTGPIMSHDFVEAALMRRAGWAVRLLPVASGSFEQAPVDVAAHLKRDARWCVGNFQHSRVLGAAGLHGISRLHFLNGMFSYASSAVWLAAIILWGALDATQAGTGGALAVAAFVMMIVNLLFPRVLGLVCALRIKPGNASLVIQSVVLETLFSSLIAPALMLQRMKIIFLTFCRPELKWPASDQITRSIWGYCSFHAAEVLLGLGILACVERQFLSPWFFPLAMCFVLTPLLSYFSAQPVRPLHTKN
jgi:membrane glycosyltransferase